LATALLVIVVALVAAVQIIPQARGGASLIIETGSMRPSISPGDVVAVMPVPTEQLNVGDIITYATADKLITHRIIAIQGQGDHMQVITQGDANNTEDAPVLASQVRGRVTYTIPRVGLVLPWLTEHVFWVVGGAAAIWGVSWFIENLRKAKKEKIAKDLGIQLCALHGSDPKPATCGSCATVHSLEITKANDGVASVSLNQIANNLPAFLGAPSATLVRTKTAVTAFSEPIEISAEKNGTGQHLAPVTVVRTPSMTTAYNEPITVTAAVDGNLNMMRGASAASGARAVRVTDVRVSKQQVTVEQIDTLGNVNPNGNMDVFDAAVLDAADIPELIAAWTHES